MKLLIIAWRNIWRNKRRTLITVAAVCFAVFFAIIMRAMQEGTYTNAINNMVRSYTGHLQIQNIDYWDEQTIDNSFEFNDSIQLLVQNNPLVDYVFPRLQSFAFASTGIQTKEAIVMGQLPEDEGEVSKLEKKLVLGELLTNTDDGILIAEGLAQYLGIIEYDSIPDPAHAGLKIAQPRFVNDSVILIGQGMYAQSANGIFKVKGVIKFPVPDVNKRIVIMPLQRAQIYYSAKNRLTSLSVILKSDKDQDAIVADLESTLDSEKFAVMTWQEMMVQVVQQIESDKSSGILMIALLYLIIGFSIFGTVVMMTAERKREFAVMVAVGMQKTKLLQYVLVELLYIGIIGSIIGAILSSPLLYYFYLNPIRFQGEQAQAMEAYGWEPIMPVDVTPGVFINQITTILILFAISSLYPIFKIIKMKVIEAIKGN